MEIFAGDTGRSDKLFMLFTEVVEETLVDSSISGALSTQTVHIIGSDHEKERIRHQALQLALVFMCGVGQLSPGAYFLRKDLFPSLVLVRHCLWYTAFD